MLPQILASHTPVGETLPEIRLRLYLGGVWRARESVWTLPQWEFYALNRGTLSPAGNFVPENQFGLYPGGNFVP